MNQHENDHDCVSVMNDFRDHDDDDDDAKIFQESKDKKLLFFKIYFNI